MTDRLVRLKKLLKRKDVIATIISAIAAVSMHISFTYGWETVGNVIHYAIYIACVAYFLYYFYGKYIKKKAEK